MNSKKNSSLQNSKHQQTLKGKVVPINYPYINISDWRNKRYLMLVKRVIDVMVAFIVLASTFPLCLILALVIKLGSPGPVLYSQIRVGKNKKTFHIIKFRTMYLNAENKRPVCAAINDPRITAVGKWMRKTHLDEIPNFINVLKGDMSVVGPRPERPFFVKIMLHKAPQFANLLTVKPGITSWGQVKFGYAHNVNEMITRMLFDLEYLNDNSLKTDLKIVLKTILVVFKEAF
jgi:lipopolysaccharide/colanic/teichoic acid biosynthesis glycosyltransferase